MEENPHAKPSAAPIAPWAERFKSSGLTEEQMRTAVRNRKAAQRKAGTAERPATKRKAAVVLPDEFVKIVKLW